MNIAARKFAKGFVYGMAIIGAKETYDHAVKAGIIVPSRAKEKVEEAKDNVTNLID